jgi:hypothetical protein
MASRRSVVSIELVAGDGVRVILDADGLRLVNPRQLGHAQRARADELLERLAGARLPVPEPPEAPPTLEDDAKHLANAFRLRVAQRRFKNG